MKIQIPNPARAVWRYMRGEDIQEANQRAVAAYAARTAAAANRPPPVAPAPGGSESPAQRP